MTRDYSNFVARVALIDSQMSSVFRRLADEMKAAAETNQSLTKKDA